MNIQQLAAQAIYRAQNMRDFEVLVDEDRMILNGTMRYSIRHRPGHPYQITVQALSQAEAEDRVNEWIDEMRNAG